MVDGCAVVSGSTSPALAGGFPHHSPQNSVSHGRTDSTGSVATNVITRKVLTVFPPLLPDELVLAAGEKVRDLIVISESALIAW